MVLAAIGTGLWLLSRWNHERGFRPLYTNLTAEDAGVVMAKLKAEGVEYRVDDSGTVQMLPRGLATVAARRVCGPLGPALPAIEM